MKLKNIYLKVKNNYKIISEVLTSCSELEKIMERSDKNDSEKINYYTHTIKWAKKAVEQLSDIECLQEQTELFFQNDPYNWRGHLDVSRLKDFNNVVAKLLDKMKWIIDFCEPFEMDSEEMIGIDIKMPKSEDFTEFKKNISELEFIITKCPFFQNEKESLKFENVDIGSFWLTFTIIGGTVAGSILLNNIAAFVDKCMVIRSHYLTTQKQKNDLEKERIEKTEKEIILKYLDGLYKTQVDNAIKEMEELSGYTLEDGEEVGRAEQSFEKLAKLIDKGLQIYSTIDTPEETKVLFKPLEMRYLEISDKLKLIEEKEDSGEKNS